MRLLLTYILLLVPLIGLSQPPTAQFVSGNVVACVGEPVNFTDLSVANGSPIVSWSWDFGDGNASNAVNPSHSYSTAGNYTIILVVSAANGQADSEVKFAYITINPKPIPDFSSTANGCALPVGVTFTNLTIGGQSYEWDFGNGQTSTLENPAMVTYAVAGNYSVTLISTNSFGCKDTITQNIVISDFQAGMTAPTTACEGAPINITDNSTVGANVWNWTFTGGNPAGSTNQNEVVTYPSPGVYTIQLTAQNTVAGCSDNTNQSITVLPTPTPTFTGTPTSGCAPQAVNFTNTTGSPGTYIWDFGDGSSFNGTTPPSHTYSTDGSYSVGLTFTDANGCIGSTLLNNYINLNSPIASFAAPVLDGCAPLSVQLASTSVSAIDPIIDWQWDFGDGTSFNGEVPPSHDYAVGTYAVTLTITTQGGCVATVTIPNYIQVGQIDLVDFSWNPPISCANVPIDFVDESIISVPHDPSEVIYSWDFGDGGTSTLEDPSYPYSADTGYFDVQLVVEFRGCLDTLIEPNAVYILAPISIFQPSQSLFCNPASFPITVTVNDNSIIGILSDDADMTWNWGDGTSTNYDDPDFDDPDQGTTSHDYAAYGSYTITQIINNYTTGCVDSSNTVINISQIIAGLSIDVDSLCLGFPVTVASTSTSTHPFGTFDWNMGNGEFLNGDNLPYVYGASGNYLITLTATNVLGCSDTEILTPVTVLQPPTAGISANDYMGCAPFLVTFSNNSMVQGNGVPLDSFQFTFFDDGSIVNTNNVLTTVDHTFNSSGVFAVEIIATDQFGCVSPPSSAIISVTKPFADFNVQNVVCNNESFTANNNSIGLEPMTYQWFVDGTQVSTNTNYSSSFNEPFDLLSSSASHDLMLITTDANGCKDTMQQTIVVSTPVAALSYLLDGAATNANGDFVCPPVFADFTDQTLSYGSISTWSWTFGDGKTSNLQSPSNTYVFSGTYSASLSITDEFGCTSDTVLIDFLTIFGPTASPTWSDFVNACGLNVSLDIGVTQNVTSNVWNLDDGAIVIDQNSVTHIYSVPGTYEPFVTVYDANNCQVIYPLGPFTLTQPQLSINALGDVILCHGSADGNITGTVTGGAAPYVVTLNQTGTTQAIAIDGGSFDFGGLSGASSGGFASYTVTVTDASGALCSVTSTVVTISEPSLAVSVVLDAQQNIICFGNATGSINVTASGGTAPYSYLWTGPNGFTSSLEDLSGLVAGAYSLQVVDANGLTGGCASSLSVTLTQPTSGLAVSLDNQQNVDCFGNASGSINVTASGGTQPYTYSWTGPNGFSSTLDDISLLEAGNYSFIVTDANGAVGSCASSLNVTIQQPTPLTITTSVTTDYNGYGVSCYQLSDAAILAVVGGGVQFPGGVYSYSWTADPATPSAIVPVGQEGLMNPNGLTAGNYLVTVTDNNGCTINDQILVTEPSELQISSLVPSLYPNGLNISGCSPDGFADVSAVGGVPAYTFDWSNDGVGDFNDPTQVINLAGGWLYVVAQDLNGCQVGDSVFMTFDFNLVTASAESFVFPSGDNISCFNFSDGSIDLTVNGGTTPYAYSWLADPATPTATIPTGQEIVQDPNGVTAGNYIVTITDQTGCTVTTSINLSQPSNLLVSAVVPDLGGYNVAGCLQNGSINLTVSGGSPGYSILWSNSETTEDIDSLAAGPYSVEISDINGCQFTLDTVLIESEPLIALTVVTTDYNGADISCFNASDGGIMATISGGAPAYIIQWFDSLENFLGDQAALNGLPDGDYTIIVQDQYGCLDTSVVNLQEPTLVQYDISVLSNYNGWDISCFGAADGMIDFFITGGTPGYTFQWSDSNAVVVSNIEDPTGLVAGLYFVSAADLNGCPADTTIILDQPTPLVGQITITSDYNGQNVSCFGASDGSLNGFVEGGVPDYSYTWTDQSGNIVGNGLDVNDIPGGEYYMVATDLNGCLFIDSIVVQEPPALTVSPTIVSFYFGAAVSCDYASDGIVDANASGGLPGYTYSWNTNPAQNASLATGLSAGTYTVTVTDVNGCTSTNTIVLNANPSPQPVLPEPGVGCIGSNILINAVQGDWQYCSWTFSDGQNFTECAPFVTSFDSVGCYSLQLTVLNEAGCMGSAFSSNFICVEPNPVASFYADNYEISNVEPGVVFINTSTGADSYYWYYSDVSYYDSTINVYHEFSGGDEFGVTDYTVILYAVSQYGCIDSTSRRITMLPELIVYVPNAFTPDGDIYNNTFFPVISGGYTTEDYSFLIFNRWGELIYESSEMGEGWDGSYRGKKCQDGVYTWKLNVRKSYTDEIKEYVGHVSVLRGGRP